MAEAKKAKSNSTETGGALVVACPECEKKFKPKSDVRGKKIKCPFCTHPFVVPMGKAASAKSEAVESAKPAAAPAPVVTEAPKPAYDDDDDGGDNPYGVKQVDLTPRCPNCTEEMGPHDIICLSCGYNTLTREWGRTNKTVGITFGQHFMYLLPALGSASFMFFSIVFLIYYTVVSPYHFAALDNWVGWVLRLSDHESMRMWTTVIFLLWIWMGGMFCFKKFIEKPKPDEVAIE